VEFANYSGDQLVDQILNDRYQIKSLLGYRTGRRTFLATDIETGLPVVIKLLLFGPDFTWNDLKLFEREAQTLQTLNHPFIPRYLDSFEINTLLGKGFAFVQSYIEAQPLQNWVEQGRHFSEADLREIAKKLLDILVYLHSHQPPVIHRDIKPSNILLGDRSGNNDGDVYLVDFGSVQTVAHHGTITVVGTYGYMPPEQFGGKTTPASDLYSLGATLIYLLTRTHPADLPNRRGIILFEAEHSVSELFQTWLKYLIQPDVSQRFKNAQLALETLQSDHLESSIIGTICSKPKGSNVSLSKTDEQLRIVIPPLQLEQKWQVIQSSLILTIFTCAPLYLSLWKLQAGLLFAPIVVWIIIAIWINSSRRIFIKTEIVINQDQIYFSYDWLGLKRRYISPVEDVIRLERLQHTVQSRSTGDSLNPVTVQFSGLYIWVGNKCYTLGKFKSMSREPSQLTEVEIDWLATELSEWLDLPIQRTGEIPVFKEQNRATLLAPATKFNSTNQVSNRSGPSSEVSRPEDAVCTIYKDTETIAISAPVANGNEFLSIGCLLLLILFIAVTSAGVSFWFALLLGIVPATYLGKSMSSNQTERTTRIILQIDQREMTLWQHAHQSGKRRCLKQADRSRIHKLELVSQCGKERRRCHIKLCTGCPSNNYEDGFLVGNQSFWLSRTEADWLAFELSEWLKLPITEVKIVESTVA